MLKTLPPLTIAGISPPNPGYHHFQDAAAHPFQPQAEGISLLNAWWCADASLLAYAPPQTMREALARAGFVADCFAGADTQGFIAHNEDAILIAFRGTEVSNLLGLVNDLRTDAQASLVQEQGPAKVHLGFQQALDAVWGLVRNGVQSILSDGVARAVWLTGNSLGGALATLAAARAVRENAFAVQGCYTYGAPRVGNKDFAAQYAGSGLALRTHRFVNGADLVARLPPALPEGCYKHCGTLHYLDKAGQLGPAMPPEDDLHFLGRVMLGLPLTAGWLLLRLRVPDFIADHAPISYSVRLWNLYQSAISTNTGQ